MTKIPKDKVFILIPVYNRRETTLGCLEILRKTGDLECFHVVVIDDGSTDGTGAAIALQYPQVTVLQGDGNLWWTGAIKKGMEYAYQQGADYFIWLNDDCYPQVGALHSLVQFMDEHPRAIVAPVCELAGSERAIENGCRHRQRYAAKPGEIIQVESVSGYCVGLPRDVCDEIGYPDVRRFPHYAGDDMYTLKASRNGYTVNLIGDALVTVDGMEQDEHTFRSYVQERFKSCPSLTEIFGSKKSRYFLRSKYFYLTTKYPLILGILLFSCKLTTWLIQYVRIFVLDGFKEMKQQT